MTCGAIRDSFAAASLAAASSSLGRAEGRGARPGRFASASTRTKNGENEPLISPRETKRFAGMA
jgi:hypothetical protein